MSCVPLFPPAIALHSLCIRAVSPNRATEATYLTHELSSCAFSQSRSWPPGSVTVRHHSDTPTGSVSLALGEEDDATFPD